MLIFPSLYGAGSAAATAEATNTDEIANVLKSILITPGIFCRINECVSVT